MKLTIKLNKEINLVKIGFAKESLDVYLSEVDSVNNTSWNTQGINTFLIKLSAATPNGEKIEVEVDEEENQVYQHIVDIFKAFTNVYNSMGDDE